MRMKKWKRVTASALSICMLATCSPCLAEVGGLLQSPVTVHAETGDVIMTGNFGNNATWNYNRTTKVLTITGTGTANPKYDNSVYRYKTEAKKLVFSDGITEISFCAFEDFTALEDIQFGGVKKIGGSAFGGCTALKNLDLDENLEEIGVEAFCDCKNLTTVTVGSKVKTAYWDIFKGCDSLTSITVNKDNTYLHADGKELLNAKISGKCGKNVTFSYNRKTKTLTLSGSGAMYDGDHDIDEELEQDLYSNSFTNSPYKKEIQHEMRTLVVGDNITNIGNCAFSQCDALKTVKLGKNVRTIGNYAFTECNALESIQLGNNIKSIGIKAFFGCKKLKSFSIGKSVKTIGEGAFSECANLSKLSVHKSNQYFSKRGNMLLNKNQSKIVAANFGSNKTCNIYGSVKSIDENILADSSVKRFSVNKNNTKYASKNGLLYSKDGKILKRCPAKMSGIVNTDDTVTSIDPSTFRNCNHITQINIGKNVKSLDYVFKYVYIENLEIQVSNKNKYYYETNGSIISRATNELIYCYKIDGDTYTVPDSVKKIGMYAFTAQKNLKHLILSDNVTELDSEAFCVSSDPTGLTHINIESIHLGNSCNLLSQNNYMAIDYLKSLKEVTVSNENPNYTSIGGVLYNKDVTELEFLPGAIENYTIPESVTRLNENSISSYYLKNLTISDTITDVVAWTREFNDIESLHLGKNVNNITNAFLSNLKYISVSEENSNFKVINNMLYSKDGSKFILCPSETAGKVVLEEGVTEISENAFGNCSGITDIVIPGTISKVADFAFGQQPLEYAPPHPVASGYVYNYPIDYVVIWVPKGTMDYYKSLFTPKTGFLSNMVIKELEN